MQWKMNYYDLTGKQNWQASMKYISSYTTAIVNCLLTGGVICNLMGSGNCPAEVPTS